MTYAVGQTIEVCLDLDLPSTQGIRRIVAVFVDEHGETVELTDVPTRVSQCVLQDHSQTALRGRATHPSVYELRQVKVKDLLEESGFSGPPETYDELKEMALKTKQDSGTKFGFVFQGANYEGGVCNALEYIWNYGGDVLAGDRPVVDSPEAIAGLSKYRSMIADGVTTRAMTTYMEEESQAAFLNGDAVFMRNWSYVYALTSDPAQSKIEPDQVGLSTLPVAEAGQTSTNVLGATNLYVNATTQSEEASWALIRYFTAPEQQKLCAIEGARIPVLKNSYEDKELLREMPVMELGKKALQTVRPRPVSPYYSDMSLEMAEQFNAILAGETTPERGARTLQSNLETIIEQGKNL